MRSQIANLLVLMIVAAVLDLQKVTSACELGRVSGNRSVHELAGEICTIKRRMGKRTASSAASIGFLKEPASHDQLS